MYSWFCLPHPLYLTIFNPTSPLPIFPDLLLCDSLLIFTWTEYYMTFGLELSVGTLWLFHWYTDVTMTVSPRIHQWSTVHHRRKVTINPSPSHDWVLQVQCQQLALAVRSVFAVALSYSQGCFMRPSFPPSSSYLVFTEPSRDEIEMSCFGLSIKPSLLSYPEQPRICM